MSSVVTGEQVDELIIVLQRLATAAEHAHRCDEEISQTLKQIKDFLVKNLTPT
jgi:hypothetical protein